MAKLLSIDPDVMKRIRGLPKSEKTECLIALCNLHESFGQPHLHSGVGIRKLGATLFECRGNRSLRYLFQNRAGDLYVFFLGNHDEIKSLLRSRKL
ncbi:hypothetical protein L0244_10980 [bacterium]|nr:hypothetical protein [bacterium]MCI0613501.1 hypothetical protein [bacterium]